MCKKLIGKLVDEYGAEYIIKCIEFFKEGKKPKTSLEKYLINSKKRKVFNKVYLNNVDIIYTFKDGDDNDLFALDVEYTFNGSIENNSLGYLLLYLSLKDNNYDNVSIEAIDCRKGNNRVTPEISKKDNGGKAYGDNGAYWRIPFYGGNRRYMDSIKTKLKIRWKRFAPKGEISNLMIDPRNYAEKSKVEKITITVVNESSCEMTNIKMSEYNRKTQKLFAENSEYEIYNAGNNTNGNKTLIDKHEIVRQEIDENKVFVLKCEKHLTNTGYKRKL
ncbi:MAG: hypothetical protein IKB55_05430 [Clostridia bacterium]|nr:hypothetical protein [Clostridia bacterium]